MLQCQQDGCTNEMTLAEACALAHEIQRDERAPWRVNKIEQWGPLTFWVNVSALGTPSAGWWFRNRQEWEQVRDSITYTDGN